ncbi:LuxR family transcriptional regulator [Actinomadura barringtoniae]|uniref:LuxR family transcriptional regulator n=1 Tax=Actinomadura barringtoniae TaxID=1427535 RepID=A0A939PCT0_9ACTN|nr:NB-ARC domain-containing protein [Actinomadura barringtoniae]MBO2446101.1 LuxR family transcriptional regulator [Actinomadura barringtoniae]
MPIGPQVGNLRAEPTRMVGRDGELAQVRVLCAQSRLVTLTGPGGVGKTRLALRAAAELRPKFDDGAWLVELSPLGQGSLLTHTIAETLPLADQTTRPMLDVLAEYLAGRRLLVVLDTCEHVLDSCAMVVAALLDAAPGLHVLATSRRPLVLPDERLLTVGPLPVPDETGAGPQDAMALLADRAAAAVPGFSLTDDDRADALRVCRKLEGLPLAIELAAARLPDVSLKELADRLDDRFEVLNGAADDSGDPWEYEERHDDPRHRALRTAIGWSHELCGPHERLAWARFSVFADTFDEEAARRVCADRHLTAKEITAALGALVNASILTRSGSGRYRMLDTVREYGAFWLRTLGEYDTLRRRHRDHYLALARQGCAEWAGPRQRPWCERVITEHANMRAAMGYSLIEPTFALDMAGHVGFLWRHCGFPREGQRCLEAVLRSDPEPGAARTWALFARGSIAFAQGDLRAAGHWGTLCAAAADNDQEAMAAAVLSGMSLAMRGDVTRATEVLDAAPAPGTFMEDPRYRIVPFQFRLVRLYTHFGARELTQARRVGEDLRADCVDQGERWVRAYADHVLAMVALAQGDPAAATGHARDALEGHRVLGNSTGIAVVLDGLASAVLATGDAARAAWLLGLGQRYWHLIGSAQMDSPSMVALRRKCESRAEDALGESIYRAAFAAGYDTDPDTGVAGALTRSPEPAS